ncbi:hypothetical protein N665_2120s0006 [Sinapis alba]|nr:hypothetical protein N665_2120s0006 [Sinapis alba]
MYDQIFFNLLQPHIDSSESLQKFSMQHGTSSMSLEEPPTLCTLPFPIVEGTVTKLLQLLSLKYMRLGAIERSGISVRFSQLDTSIISRLPRH